MDLYGRVLHDVLFPGFEAIRGRPTVSLMRYLDRTQWAGRDELHAIQSGLLRRLIRHAYQHTAHFRAVFDERGLGPGDLREPADLNRLPLLDRAAAQGSIEARRATVPPFAVIEKRTTGSTGLPMVVPYNAESRYWRDATRWRGYGWAGYRPGIKALHYWGAAAAPPPNRRTAWKIKLDRAMNRNLYIDCSSAGEEQLDEVIATIRSYRPGVIVAFSQAIALLARHVLRTSARRWEPIPVLVGAERLFPNDRVVIEEAFGPAFETYGSREFMMMASECEVHDGMHLAEETQVAEIVVREPDGSTRLARPGESGMVVITDLHNLAAPMIRYVTGDLAVARPVERCACGRWLHRIGPIEGRIAEMMRDARGNPVNGLIWPILFTPLGKDAKQYQMVQHKDGTITMRLVPVSGELPADARALIQTFAAKYLPGVPLTIEVLDDIPAGPGGKRHLVVVEK
jgi:phenylacetate-CoA ligase